RASSSSSRPWRGWPPPPSPFTRRPKRSADSLMRLGGPAEAHGSIAQVCVGPATVRSPGRRSPVSSGWSAVAGAVVFVPYVTVGRAVLFGLVGFAYPVLVRVVRDPQVRCAAGQAGEESEQLRCGLIEGDP